MQLHNLFAVHSDTFRHVQETFDVPLSPTQPYNPGSYDVCLVIPLRRKEMSMETVHMLERVISTCGRKYVYMYNDETDTKRFVLIRGGSTRLRSKAEQTGTKLPLDDRQCLLLAQEGYPESNIAPIRIAHTPQLTPFRPFEYLFARYVTRDDKVEALYRTVATDADYADVMGGVGGGGGGLFPKADRIRLLDRMLNDSEADDGADANTRQQLQDGLLLGYFPLHANEPAGEGTFAHDLVSWAVLPWHKPLDELNEYFGSRIAFYLAFLNHVCGWLIAPALVGAGCQAAAVALNNYSRPEIPVFAFFIAVWAVLVREHWRRQEKLLGMRWNSLDEPDGSGGGGGGSGSVAAAAAALLDSARDARPQFRGILLDHSHIDGKPLLYRRHGSALRTALVASVSVAVIALACVGVAAAIYVVRWLLYYTPVGRFNQFVSSGINAVTIQLLQYAFRGLAVALADLENHRTDDEYYASLTVKMVLFSFVNNFTAFYYLAFGARYLPQGGNKDSVGMCGYDDCMVAVGINLAALFGVRLVVGLFLFRALPFLRHAWNHGHCSCLHCYYTARRLVLACAYRLFLCRPYYAEDDDVQNEYELRVAEAPAAEEEKQGGNAELGQLGSYDQKLEDWGFSRAEWEYLLPGASIFFCPAYPLSLFLHPSIHPSIHPSL